MRRRWSGRYTCSNQECGAVLLVDESDVFFESEGKACFQCPECSEANSVPEALPFRCDNCEGKGTCLTSGFGNYAPIDICSKCKGSGIIAGLGEYTTEQCNECNGGLLEP